MSNLKVAIADKIASKAIKAYNELPKNGKPVDNEWTVLSCVVLNNKTTEKMEVVSLGTGSKCIGASKMSPKGDVLNDSHAEVMARRGFLVYLYDNIKRSLEGENTIFVFENNKFKLKNHIEFYFYSSQLPCGDACIMPKSVEETLVGPIVQSNKRPAEDNDCEANVKKQKTDSGDIYRTGAKCLPHSDQDMKDPGTMYHLLVQVRTKPGRGDPTLSVSCSDKMSRWIHLGIHGGLLDMILHEPIYIKLFVFGGRVPYSIESLERALLRRNVSNGKVELECIPELLQSTIMFPHIRTETNVRPSPGSIVWVNVKYMSAEVAVQGRRLGVTKKKAAMHGALCINKCNLYKRFLEILFKNEELKTSIVDKLEGVPYNVMKSKSERYIKKWTLIKKTIFGTWTVKPDIWNFSVDLT